MAKTKKLTGKALLKQIQEHYAEWLRRMDVDIVNVDKGMPTFGWPAGMGDTGFLRFKPLANGRVAVCVGYYSEKVDYEKFESFDSFDSLEEAMGEYCDAKPSTKKAKPRKNYRY